MDTKPECITVYYDIPTLKSNEPSKKNHHLNHLILIITNRRFIFIDKKSTVEESSSTISYDFSDLLNTEAPKRAVEIFSIIDIKDIVFPPLRRIEDKQSPFAIQIKFPRDKILTMTGLSKETFLSFRDQISNSLDIAKASLNKVLNLDFSNDTKIKLDLLVKDPAINKLYQELVVNQTSKCMTHYEFFEKQDAIKEKRREAYIDGQHKGTDSKFYYFKKRKNDEGEEIVCMTPEDKQRQFDNFPGLKKDFEDQFLDNFGDRRDDEAKFWDNFWRNQKQYNSFLFGLLLEGKGIKSEMPTIPNQSSKMDIEFENDVKQKVSVEFDNDIYEKYPQNKGIDQDEVDASNENLLKFINNYNAALFKRDCGNSLVSEAIDRAISKKENYQLFKNEFEILSEELDFSNENSSKKAEQSLNGINIDSYNQAQDKIRSISKQSYKVPSNEELDMRKNAWRKFVETRIANNENIKDQFKQHQNHITLGLANIGGGSYGENFFDIQSDSHAKMRISVARQADNYANRKVHGNEYDKNFQEKLNVLSSKVYEISKLYYSYFPLDKNNREQIQLMKKLLEHIRGTGPTHIGLLGELGQFKQEVDGMSLDDQKKNDYKNSIKRIEKILHNMVEKTRGSGGQHNMSGGHERSQQGHSQQGVNHNGTQHQRPNGNFA